MKSSSKEILIFCPGGEVTGGPEVLHQLVDQLRSQKKSAAICYYPFETKFEIPIQYACYDVVVKEFSDNSNQIVVIPETATHLMREIRKSKPLIWWLSVDNYYGRFENRYFSKLMRMIEGGWRQRRHGMSVLSSVGHLAQSSYARDFLIRNGMDATMLTDYLAQEHLENISSVAERKDVIAYNPKKGNSVIRKLRRLLPSLSFIPIRGMTKAEVAVLLSSAKVYVDFGHHPGKDRLPREAAMAGACIITGLRGSAAFFEDIPIPSEYKLDDHSPHLAAEFDEIVKSIFENFDYHSGKFDFYRKEIKKEKIKFSEQVAGVFQ